MISLPFAIVLSLYGVWLAHRRKGGILDMAQYGAGFFLLGLILGTALAIALNRFI